MLSLSIFHVSAKIIHNNGPYFIRGEREGGCEFLGLSRQSFKSFNITINIRIKIPIIPLLSSSESSY